MPTIESYKPKKIFKKTALRAWDVDLNNKLKINYTESGTKVSESGTESGTKVSESGTESGTKVSESGTESGTKVSESGTESGTKVSESGTESGTKVSESGTESGTKVSESGTESGTKVSESGTESGTKVSESGTESGTKIKFIKGLNKKILFFLLDNLVSKYPPLTKKLNLSIIASSIDSNANSVKQAISRMKKMGWLLKHVHLSGYYGFTSFEIPKNIYKSLNSTSYYSNNNINTNITIKKKDEENSKLEETSNQNNNIKTRATFISNNSQKLTRTLASQNTNVISKSELTNKANEKLKYEELPEEWKNINYHFLDDLHFKQHHIVGLYKLDVLEPEVVQESIEHFAYGIKHNPDSYKKYTDPLKVFYGSLRKGKPWTESTYKSTKEMATEDLIQRRKSEKRKIANETCKLVEEMEKESYEKWYYSLSEEEKKEIKEKHKLQESGIFNIFDEKIYKLHYGKYVMEEYKDPSELALEEFIAKKKRKEEAEAKRIKKMLQEGGMIKEYYKWAGELKEVEIKEITEEEGGMTERGQNKMIIYYAKQIAK